MAIILLIYFILKLIKRVVPIILKKVIEKKFGQMGGGTYTNYQEPLRKEGEVHIKSAGKSTNSQNGVDDFEDVDYEEVK